MKLGVQKNILAIVQNVILCMISILVELNNYQTMSRLIYLGGSLLIMVASFYPLLSLIKALGNVREISTLAIGLIIIWLVVALIFGLLLFYFTWNDIIEEEEEKYIQLHFKGAVYTVPEIYQESKLKFVQAYIAVQVCIKSQQERRGDVFLSGVHVAGGGVHEIQGVQVFSPNSIHQLSWKSNRFLIYGSWVRVPYVSQQMIP